MIDKSDASKKKSDFVSFIDNAVPIRNKIMHMRGLEEDELNKLSECYNYFHKFYERWKNEQSDNA